MNRIKFRGKRKDNGEWVYGYYFVLGERAFIVPDIEQMFSICTPEISLWSFNEVIPETVGQFTGLCDKNGEGEELYEADICRANWCCAITFDSEPHKLIGSIEWDETDLIWRFDYGHGSVALSDENLTNIKRIGNIHESPKLPEQEK